MTNIEEYIINQGVVLSGDLIKFVLNEDKSLSNDAARKRVSRVTGEIGRVTGLFVNKQILFYDKFIYNTEEYYSGLIDALKSAGKQYYSILQLLDFHYGYLHKDQICSYSVNPLFNIKGHITFSSALERLISYNLVYEERGYISLSKQVSKCKNNFAHSRGIEFAKNFLLNQFNELTRGIGMISYDSTKFHSDFGKYQFNLVAPSYICSLTSFSGGKIIPAFVIADVLISNTITEKQVEYFISKTDVLLHQRNLPKFIPYLIVDSISTKALNKLKAKGIVVGFIDKLFGDNYKELLSALINLITNAGAILKNNPENYLDLITKLNKLIDGKTNNLKGDLFELAVGYYQGQVCQTIDIGKLIRYDEKPREIDVFGVQSNKVFVCECKGYSSRISKEIIETWLGEKIPVIRKWILDQEAYSSKSIVFEFWSTGGFTAEAVDILKKRKKNTRRYSIEYYDLEDMLKLSKDINSKKFTDVLREYYTKSI